MAERIVCYGDVIDDIVVAPRGPIRADTDTPALIRSRPGGSSANTAAWLASLGAAVDLVAVVGRGDVQRHVDDLPGVSALLREHETLQTGRVIVIVQGERRDMLTDRGANVDLSPKDVSDSLLRQARLLHLTGHALLNTDGFAGVRTLIERCRAREVMVSVSPGSAGFLEDIGVDRALRAFAGADVVFSGLEDGLLLTGSSDPEAAALALNAHFPLAVVTRGSSGVTVSERGSCFACEIQPEPVVDPTGAGDAFCAGFLNRWIDSWNARDATEAGIALAAKAVGVLGGRPV